MLENLGQSEKQTLARIGGLFAEAGFRVLLVGGSVRDLLTGRELKDADLATDADQDRIFRILHKARSFEAVYDKSQAKGFGTVGARLGGLELDITPLRTCPGSGRADPVEQDLSCRDFTINAVALDLGPERFLEVIDPFKGRAALQRRLLRTPRPPLDTLEDDPLRILRAARFIGMGFELEPEFDDAVAAASHLLQDPNRVSTERVRDELFRIVSAAEPAAGMGRLHEWGLIHWLLPGFDLEYAWGMRLRMLESAAALGGSPLEGLMALLVGAEMQPGSRAPSTRAAQRLGDQRRLSRLQTRKLADVVRAIPRWLTWNPAQADADPVGWMVNNIGESFVCLATLDRAALAVGLDRDDYSQVRKQRVELVESLSPEAVERFLNPPLPLDGRQVAESLGIELERDGGGPVIGRALDLIRDRVVRGELEAGDHESARELLREWNRDGGD